MCTENINLQYKTIFTSFGQNTAKCHDNQIPLTTICIIILARSLVETTMFCITSNGKRKTEKFLNASFSPLIRDLLPTVAL